MWQEVIIGALVGLAVVYLLRRVRHTLSGKTACEQGLCEGCALARDCAEAQTPEGQSTDRETIQAP